MEPPGHWTPNPRVSELLVAALDLRTELDVKLMTDHPFKHHATGVDDGESGTKMLAGKWARVLVEQLQQPRCDGDAATGKIVLDDELRPVPEPDERMRPPKQRSVLGQGGLDRAQAQQVSPQ
jgi:hypothetical protein